MGPWQGEGRGFESRRPLGKVLVGSYVSDVRILRGCLVWEPLGISTTVNWSGRWKLAFANRPVEAHWD